MIVANPFPTIGSSHWSAMFAAHRRQGAIEGLAMLAQIRAAVRRETTFSTANDAIGASPRDKCAEAMTTTGAAPLPAVEILLGDAGSAGRTGAVEGPRQSKRTSV